MTWTSEKLGRTGAAALAAAVASVLFVSGYHPCEGIAPLWLIPLFTAGIAVLASLPRVKPRAMLPPGAAAITVLAFAIGLDYSSSGSVSPDGQQCNPVPDLAGFLLAASMTAAFAANGLALAMIVVWVANALQRGPAQDQQPFSPESSEG